MFPMLDDPLFCTIQIPTDQVNLCLPILSWKGVSGMRCQLEINAASLHKFTQPIFVYLLLILTTKLSFLADVC